jgi:hypothetical protein
MTIADRVAQVVSDDLRRAARTAAPSPCVTSRTSAPT